MFSNKMDFSSCVIWIDFHKSGHNYGSDHVEYTRELTYKEESICHKNKKDLWTNKVSFGKEWGLAMNSVV